MEPIIVYTLPFAVILLYKGILCHGKELLMTEFCQAFSVMCKVINEKQMLFPKGTQSNVCVYNNSLRYK